MLVYLGSGQRIVLICPRDSPILDTCLQQGFELTAQHLVLFKVDGLEAVQKRGVSGLPDSEAGNEARTFTR